MVDRAMTVQELIDELMKVEDKSKRIAFYSLNDVEEKKHHSCSRIR